jgi:hypothetical protein
MSDDGEQGRRDAILARVSSSAPTPAAPRLHCSV